MSSGPLISVGEDANGTPGVGDGRQGQERWSRGSPGGISMTGFQV